ncbi:MAG TPA: ester cyclase [Pyrinomonadaceae bacterium]|jgi:steroid delta-isomerase-like uncharacterized protein
MAEEHENFLRRWFEEVWNKKNEGAIDRMCCADVVANGLTDAEGRTICGVEAYKTLFRTFVSAYPDLKITVEDTVSEGDKIAARCRVTATHTGEGLGVAPTNQPLEFTGMTMVKIKDGKIAEAWNEFDFMKMYSQFGALKLNLQ